MKSIFLFLGNEELIIKNKIDKIIKTSGCDGFNISSYDLEEVNISMVIQDALTQPFLCPSKVIVMKNPIFLTSTKSDVKHNTKMFMDYLNNPLDSTILIIDATRLSLDEKKDYVVKLLKVSETSETKELTPVEAEGWLKRQFAIENVEIKDDAIKLFFSRVGRNLLNAKNEVDKLLNYINPRKVITSKDVSEVVTKENESEVFALTNAIIDKNKEKTITIYYELTTGGKDVMQLLGLVSRCMIDILVVGAMLANGYKQTDVANSMKVSSGRAYYLVKNAKAFRQDVVEENILKLANLDYKIKSGQVEPTSGLELFIFGV
jgi:DNA polymerase-3 subunit delta